MTRRVVLVALAAFAIALVALFPLRVAVGRFVSQGFTARQVAGTIWYGRIGELTLKGRRLGTFEASLDPFALLTGAVKMRFHRLDDPNGTLDGAMVSGALKGIRNTSGRIGAAGLLGKLPVETVQLDNVNLLFRGNQCAQASGKVTATVATPLPGIASVPFAGAPSCEGDKVRFELTDPSSQGRIEFYIRSGGDYRAWLRLRGPSPDMAAALAAAGFTESPEGWMLSSEGRM